MTILQPPYYGRQPPEPEESTFGEIVERIAKVLWNQKLKLGGGGRTLMAWPSCPEAKHCRANAREIIEAMREPTEAMLKAKHPKHTEGVDGYLDDWDAIDVYQAMIDEALR